MLSEGASNDPSPYFGCCVYSDFLTLLLSCCSRSLRNSIRLLPDFNAWLIRSLVADRSAETTRGWTEVHDATGLDSARGAVRIALAPARKCRKRTTHVTAARAIIEIGSARTSSRVVGVGPHAEAPWTFLPSLSLSLGFLGQSPYASRFLRPSRLVGRSRKNPRMVTLEGVELFFPFPSSRL